MRGVAPYLLFLFSLSPLAAHWPTYRGNPQRTGAVPGQGRFASSSPLLLAHWIVHYDLNSVYSVPALADVDGDGSEEIFVGSHSDEPTMTLYRYVSGNVSEVWTSPDGDDGSVKYVCPALADVNGDGVPDAITPGDDWWYFKGLKAFSGADGSVLWENVGVDTVSYSSPLVVGDSMVVVGNDRGELRALRLSDGTELWSYSTGDTVWSSPALGDLDGDGVDEIAFTNETNLFVLELDGSLAWSASAGQWLTTPALADLDGDGDLEAVLYDAALGQLKAFDYGNSTPLWTASVEPFSMGRYYFPPSPAVGDVDADGAPEAVIGANRTLWCVDATTGSLEWSQVVTEPSDTIMGSPLLADLDGLVAPGDGGKLEIVITGLVSGDWDGFIYLVQDFGGVSWRYISSTYLQYPIENEAAIGDPDGDGELEIVAVDQSCFGVILDDTAHAYEVSEGAEGSLRVWASGRTLLLSGPQGTEVRVSLYDFSGRLAWRRSLKLGGGREELRLPGRGFVLVETKGFRKVLRAF